MLDETLEEIIERARRAEVEEKPLWAEVPCQGRLASVKACSSTYEKSCSFRGNGSCPKQILLQQAVATRERRRQALLAAIPERVLRRVYDQSPTPTPALPAVQTFLKTLEQSLLVLSGPNACGKIIAAAGVCIPPWEADWPHPPQGMFVRLVDVESAGRFSELLLRIRKSPLVVLDDIGGAYFSPSGFLATLVDDIVDAVYQKCHKLILATDLAIVPDVKDPAKPCLSKLLSRRVMSRIKDAGVVKTKLGGRLAPLT